MKRIGLATCFIDNYGACLQALALQRTIESFGYYCEIINYTEPRGYFSDKTLKQKLKNNNLIRKIYVCLKPSVRSAYETEDKFNRFRKEHLHISNFEYETTDKILNNPPLYDAYVCGSDQIWNPKLYGCNNRVYFLDFAPKGKKRIAYAPSIGLTDFPKEYADEFSYLVKKLDVVSVRESEGKNIIDRLTKKKARVVLDPTLLCDNIYWHNVAKSVNYNKSFIFCYTFGNKPYMHDVVERIQKDTGLEILYTSCTSWGNEIKNGRFIDKVGPAEFLWLIKNAKFVITDSFHATAFSLNFNTPFYTMLRNDENDKINMNSRIYSILEIVGLTDRIIDSKTALENLNYSIDFKEANSRLQKRREQDRKFFSDSLEGI